MFEVVFRLKMFSRFNRVYFFVSYEDAIAFILLLKKVYPVAFCNLISDVLVYDSVIFASADEAFADLSNRLRHSGEVLSI